jgi:hypothetical protein
VRAIVERWAPWLAGAVLVAGVAVFAVTRYTGSSPASLPGPKVQRTLAAFAPAERRAAYVFLDTAVARKHLDRAWHIVAPELKQGMSLDEWKTGTIPVVPYPVAQARVMLRVVDSFTDAARLHVTFVPRSGTQIRSATFALDLRKLGGRWLVSGWQPSSVVGPSAGK